MLNLVEPTLLLDKHKCISNIRRIVEKTRLAKVRLRPHFKTHQSLEIGRWFREMGVQAITVSSLKMAEYFAADGWEDITVAFPVNVHEHERISRLASKLKLNVLVVSPDTIAWLAQEVPYPVGLFLEIDNGYHRTGIAPTDFQSIDTILKEIQKFSTLKFSGFLSHAGHSYKIAGDQSKIIAIHRESIELLQPLKKKYKKDFPDLILSTGDTPTCSIAEDFTGVDELRPGNLVFYDITQHHIGSCTLDQIAVAMACPIVAKYPDRQEIAVHGGAVHFSKDSLKQQNGTLSFGKVVHLTETGWSTEETGMYMKSLSQEHGIIHAPQEQCNILKIGDFLGILPVHSCLTADAMQSYVTLEGQFISRL